MTGSTERTTVRRIPQRGHYDRATIDPILDEATICHVGVVRDGAPIVTPTLFARVGDRIYLHGSPASAMLRTAPKAEICVTVTLVDGYVLARSAFHHSINYRSVIVLGVPEIVEGDEKVAALDAFVDKSMPGRRETLRDMTDKEVKGTTVLSLSLSEASAKIRDGGPVDEEEDYELPIWAGVVPLTSGFGEPIDDPLAPLPVDRPHHLQNLR